MKVRRIDLDAIAQRRRTTKSFAYLTEPRSTRTTRICCVPGLDIVIDSDLALSDRALPYLVVTTTLPDELALVSEKNRLRSGVKPSIGRAGGEGRCNRESCLQARRCTQSASAANVSPKTPPLKAPAFACGFRCGSATRLPALAEGFRRDPDTGVITRRQDD